MIEEQEIEEAEAAAAEEAAAAAALAELGTRSSAAEAAASIKSTSFEADGDLDSVLVDVLSEGFAGGKAEAAAAVLTKGLVSVRTLADCETAAELKDCLTRLGLGTSNKAAKRMLRAASSIYPPDPASATSGDSSAGDDLSVEQAIALAPHKDGKAGGRKPVLPPPAPVAKPRPKSPRSTRPPIPSKSVISPTDDLPASSVSFLPLRAAGKAAASGGLVVHGIVGSILVAKCSAAEAEELYGSVAPTQLAQLGFPLGESAAENISCVESALGPVLDVVLEMGPRDSGLMPAAAALARMLATAKGASTKGVPAEESGGRPGSPLDSIASFLLSQSMGAPAKDMLEATGADRVARVAACPASSSALEGLRALSSSPTHGPSAPAKLLSAVAAASAEDASLAALLHTIKIPNASSAALGSNPGLTDPRARHAGVAAAASIVADMAVRALADEARAMMPMSSDAATRMAKMVWFGTFLKNEPDIFSVDKLVAEKKTNQIFPLLLYVYSTAHLHDPTAPRTLAAVSLIHEGLQLPTALRPYLAELSAAWDGFQHGGGIPSCAEVLVVAERNYPSALTFTARPVADASEARASAAELKASKAAAAATQSALEAQAKELKELKASVKALRSSQAPTAPVAGGKGAGRGAGGVTFVPPAPTVP
jgi:hypothetical protein